MPENGRPADDVVGEVRIAVASDADVVTARQRARAIAVRLGFQDSDPMFIATAISEIARNVVVHGRGGQVLLRVVAQAGKVGLVVIATDEGPGIADVELALRDGWSSVNSLGLGLPGARRLMDEFEIQSAPGKGTTVTMKKWTRTRVPRPQLVSALA